MLDISITLSMGFFACFLLVRLRKVRSDLQKEPHIICGFFSGSVATNFQYQSDAFPLPKCLTGNTRADAEGQDFLLMLYLPEGTPSGQKATPGHWPGAQTVSKIKSRKTHFLCFGWSTLSRREIAVFLSVFFSLLGGIFH